MFTHTQMLYTHGCSHTHTHRCSHTDVHTRQRMDTLRTHVCREEWSYYCLPAHGFEETWISSGLFAKVVSQTQQRLRYASTAEEFFVFLLQNSVTDFL
jgi:hypothetical protein